MDLKNFWNVLQFDTNNSKPSYGSKKAPFQCVIVSHAVLILLLKLLYF